MSTNPYFKRESVDQNLIENLVIESIKIHGFDFLYIPRTLVNEDDLFGEDTISKFEHAVEIEMYISTVDSFEGDAEFISPLGLEIRDSMTVVVSQKRFREETAHLPRNHRWPGPQEGDLLYMPLSNSLFEIKYQDDDSNPFYQLGKLYTYKLYCDVFRYSHEDFVTGDDRVDIVATDQVDSVTGGITIPSDPFADNITIETMGEDIFDFTENDPFSEGDYK